MLRIYLFGGVRIARDTSPGELPLTHTAKVLLAYMLLQRQRRHPREVLASLLWGDQDGQRARSSLNTAMWRLRRLLEPEPADRGAFLVSSPTGDVGFNPEGDCWLDAEAFHACVSRVKVSPTGIIGGVDVKEVDRATKLYVGPLLDGLYSDWALAERERFRRLYVAMLLVLMRHYSVQGGNEPALAYALRASEEEPLREDIHRAVMRLYDGAGQRSLALRHYQLCRATLKQQLGVEPSTDTRSLFLELAEEASSATGRLPEAMSGDAVSQLNLAIRRLEEVRSQLDQGLALIQEILRRRAAKGLDRRGLDAMDLSGLWLAADAFDRRLRASDDVSLRGHGERDVGPVEGREDGYPTEIR
jgi:DNA-binding SARP family transcriptional activator